MRSPGVDRSSALLAGGLTMLAPSLAFAGNGAHPRTPVVWSGAPCITVIDRSVNPVHSFAYAIPYEDTELTPEEVADSRTPQFFAYCRDHHLEQILPSWIAEAEAIQAAGNGLGNLEGVNLSTDVLENNLEWADCWVRITGDDERRPITFAAAAMPVLWNTTGLPAGTWVVEGYTYEPWFNLWTSHPGVFKIVDDPDPTASPPAAALTFVEQTLEVGGAGVVSGCVDAMVGSTMTFSWAISEPQLVWHDFANDVPVEGGTFELLFEPEAETVSKTVLIKLEVEDPMARTWTAHAIEYFAVTEAVGGDGCEEGDFVSNPCDTDSETGTSETGSSLDDMGDTSAPRGCGLDRVPSATAIVAGLFVLFSWRRRP